MSCRSPLTSQYDIGPLTSSTHLAQAVAFSLPRLFLCDISSGYCFFTGPWTVTCSSLCILRRVAPFCQLLRPVLLLASFPRPQSPVVGVLGLCWMWQDVPFAR